MIQYRREFGIIKILFYEKKLKLYQKSQELTALLANIKDEQLKKDIKNIL